MTNTVVDTAVMASHCGLSNSTMQHVSDVIAKTYSKNSPPHFPSQSLNKRALTDTVFPTQPHNTVD